MTLIDLVKIVEAICDNKTFKLNYRLLKDGRFTKLNKGFKSWHDLHAFLIDVSESEPADFEL